MRKAIKGLAGLTSFLLVLTGLVVCMCETADLDKQLQMMGMGAAIIAIGAAFGFVAKGAGDAVHTR